MIRSAGVALAAEPVGCEHALVRPDDRSRVNLAFFQAHVVMSNMGQLAVGVADLLL